VTTCLRTGQRALFVAAAAVTLGGCGGSTSASVAKLATTSSSGAAGITSTRSAASVSGSSPSPSQVEQDAPLKYAQCMRANGVPGFPDPQAGGGFLFQPGAGIDPSAPAFKTAQAACRKLLSNGPPTPGTQTHPSAQALAQMLTIAGCMRRHGISGFPEPRTTVPRLQPGGGVISDIDGVILVFPATLDTGSPAFTRAADACEFPLHNH